MFGKIFRWLKWAAVLAVVALGLLLAGSVWPWFGRYDLFTVNSGSMEPTLPVGSLLVVKPAETYERGDIVTFRGAAGGEPVTHRIEEVRRDAEGRETFLTKGDANPKPDDTVRSREQIIGKVRFSLPYLGYPIAWARTQVGFLVLVIIPGVLIVYHEILKIAAEIGRIYRRRSGGQSAAPTVAFAGRKHTGREESTLDENLAKKSEKLT